jgi:hypothetical protein
MEKEENKECMWYEISKLRKDQIKREGWVENREEDFTTRSCPYCRGKNIKCINYEPKSETVQVREIRW